VRRKNNYKTSETNPLTVIEKNLNVKQVYDFASKPLKLLHYEEAESAEVMAVIFLMCSRVGAS
jgi:hypothetical protein